jgi:hypothetical protein
MLPNGGFGGSSITLPVCSSGIKSLSIKYSSDRIWGITPYCDGSAQSSIGSVDASYPNVLFSCGDQYIIGITGKTGSVNGALSLTGLSIACSCKLSGLMMNVCMIFDIRCI